MNIKFFKSQRNKEIILCEDFIFYFDKEIQNENKRWIYIVRTCTGFLIRDISNTIVKMKFHNHDVDLEKVEKLKIKNKIRYYSENNNIKLKNAVNEVLNDVKYVNFGQLQKEKSIRDMITKGINIGIKVSSPDDIPKSLKFFKDERFLRYDTGYDDTNRILIFFSEYKKTLAKNIKICLIDGTFKVVPHGFYQLLTIQGLILNKFFPIVYILLKNKKSSTYRAAIEKCSELLNLNPQNIISDFEKSLYNSVNLVFKNSSYFGCYFYFVQSLWRRLQNIGLSETYKNNLEFKFF
ncbi:hypothetical protein DMUE_3879 [Dictyocoela muelleri]|nr:hypothetical protein DMUE_3879 [Dictyocoela muelleri]